MAASSLVSLPCGLSTNKVPGTCKEAEPRGTSTWWTGCPRVLSSWARAAVPLLEVSSEEAGPRIDRLGVP